LVSDLAGKHRVNYLQITLQGSQSNRDGLGAIVSVHTKTKTITKVHDGLTGYLSHGVLPLYIGLGEEKATKVEVLWPSGVRQEVAIADVPSMRIVESSSVGD